MTHLVHLVATLELSIVLHSLPQQMDFIQLSDVQNSGFFPALYRLFIHVCLKVETKNKTKNKPTNHNIHLLAALEWDDTLNTFSRVNVKDFSLLLVCFNMAHTHSNSSG